MAASEQSTPSVQIIIEDRRTQARVTDADYACYYEDDDDYEKDMEDYNVLRY